MTTGMTTNGFLLTKPVSTSFSRRGPGTLQISVDRAAPAHAGTPKSLKTAQSEDRPLRRDAPIWFRVNTVLCDETLDEVEEVARYCFDRNVPSTSPSFTTAVACGGGWMGAATWTRFGGCAARSRPAGRSRRRTSCSTTTRYALG